MALDTYALTTLNRLKTFLGISGSSNDALLLTLINTVTDFAENYCDRRFKKTAYSNEVYDGNGSNRLLLRQYPVVSGESFTLEQRDSRTNNSSWSSIDSELYFVKNSEGIIEFAPGGKFAEVPQHYRVSYTAGFNFDNQGGGNTMEQVGIADLEFAVWKIIAKSYNQRKDSSNVERESIGDYSVGYLKTAMTDLQVAEILRKYKRPFG